MNRKLVLTLTLTLLVGTLSVAFNVQTVKASGTVYIRADGSIDPSISPISTFDNVTYTLTGNITSDADGIVIERDNIVLNGAGYTVTGSGNGITLTGRSNVTIGNMTIRNFDYGILLGYSSDNNVLSGNNVTANNYCGINLVYSSNNTVSGNNVSNNGGGIWLTESSNNTLLGDNITANGGESISLSSSSNNIVSGNNVSNNGGGIWFSSSSISNDFSGNNVANNGWGISLGNSSHNILYGNNFADNGYGIELGYSSDNNVLSRNNVTANEYWGIELGSSYDNVLSGNNVTGNKGYGINLSSSSNSTLSGNVMRGNRYNFGVTGYALSHYLLSVDTSNLVDGKPVCYFMNQSDMAVNADAYPEVGYLGFVNCANVTVQGLNLTGNGQGLLLAFTNDSKITGNYVANNWYGIRFDLPSNNNVLSGNNIANNDHGIYLHYSSNNTFYGNNVTANDEGGIWVADSSSNNVFSGNNVANNGYGIELDESSNNTFSGNDVTANNGRGIGLVYSSNNVFSGNNVTANNGYGVWLVSSSDSNVFYHNNFINNTQYVHFENTGYANSWDDGYPSGGNYWSDDSGTDEFSGPNQDQPGSDGIGDNPYVIDENNLDHYPLMEPWPPMHELVVSIMAPISLRVGKSSMLTAIVTNEGLNEEASVELRLLINGTATNSTIVPILQPGDSYTLNYPWTPTVEGIYNVTAYTPPRPDEALIANNQQTIFVNVSAPEIVVSLIAPASLRVGTSSLLKATVSNQALSNETNVELRLLINGTIMNSTTISFLQSGDSYTLSYLWTPTVEGTYNVTAHASPVPGETSLENNLVTKFVTVTASLPPGMQVGVKAGDWIKCTYTISGWPSGTPYPEWLKVEFLSVEGINATVRVTMHMSDGTEPSQTMTIDVVAGGGTFQGLSGFVISANCTTGDSIYISGYGNVTIAGETTSSYAGTTRTVVYASFSQYGTQLTYYWDRLTGVMVEASVVSGGVTGTAKATETNMWQAALSGLPIEPIYLYILAALVMIIVGGAVAFIVRRRKKTPEEVENSQSELRLTRTGFRRNLGHRITHVQTEW